MSLYRPTDPRPSQRSAPRLLVHGLTAIALVLAATAALAKDDDDDDEPERRYCSATARLLFKACGHDAEGDRLITRAKCLNIGDDGERTQCLADMKQARAESGELCHDQLQGRRAACERLGEDRYDPGWSPERFDSDFRSLSNPNPYFPLGIGHRWEYRGGEERNTVEVLNQTKSIAGVTCLVLRDLVWRSGRLVEATDDWFAAGRDGSTWYCGEEVKDYESYAGDSPRRAELVSIDGSFKHGRERDKAGLIMPAHPRRGQLYLEEFALGSAEDVSEILAVNYRHGVNRTLDHLVPRELAQRLCNGDCIVTKNHSLLEPGSYALKYYARGIGFFLETVPAEGEALQLVGCNFDPRCVALPAP